jgi:hypothetical protein
MYSKSRAVLVVFTRANNDRWWALATIVVTKQVLT